MKILAFLQNQWFKDPERMTRIYAKCGGDLDKIAQLDATYLFFGCLTGRRLRTAFGEELCDQIVWANASPKLAGKSSGAFPADPEHMKRMIRHFDPGIVLTFGKIAAEGLQQTVPRLERSHVDFVTIAAPHPAARHKGVCMELAAAAMEVGHVLEREGK